MKNDCYWFASEKEGKMCAMCVNCHKEKKFGWFWPGSEVGYGDYDLQCEICKHPIYQRELNEAET